LSSTIGEAHGVAANVGNVLQPFANYNYAQKSDGPSFIDLGMKFDEELLR
jgi:hypothetical protein